MCFPMRSFLDRASRRRFAMLIFLCAFLAICVSPSAFAQGRARNKGGKGAPPVEVPPAEEKIPAAAMMSKTQAIAFLIQALTINQTEAARETLQQIVVGKINFGGHGQQAAESALAALAMRRKPDTDAFLMRLVSEPDEKVRPGDTTYPASTVRYDAVRLAFRVGSPELRVAMAKFYDRATPEIRTAIETALSKPTPANFAAEVVLLRSRAISDSFRTNLRKLILEQNAAALKQALKLAGDAPAKETPAAASAALLGQFGNFGGASTPAGGTPAGGVPRTAPASGGLRGVYSGSSAPMTPAAASAAAQHPTAIVLETVEKTINASPLDAGVVARELWQSEFVEALSAQLSAEKTTAQPVLTGLGSIPLKAARDRLRDYLQHKSPQDLGQLEKPTPAVPSAPGGAASPMGGLGAGGMGIGRGMRGGAGAKSTGAAAAQGPAFLVGADWLDPGSLVVLKTLIYKDRPKSRHRTPTPSGNAGKRSAAAEKKAEELAEKQKQAEAQYEWRDTIEKFVSHWDDRLSAVAEKHEAAETDSDTPAETKEKADTKKAGAKEKKDQTPDQSKPGSTKSTKESDPTSKKAVRTADSKSSSDSKAKGSVPTPAVPLPFVLRPGEHITKEFHLRWPEDLPSNLTAAVSEPLVVHYLQLEASDDMNRTATFYRGSLVKVAGAKAQSTTHDIAEGKWVDILQHDPNGQRTRSLDILVTRQPADPDAKKSKIEDLTIQVLMVEVESFVPDSKPAEKKEQAKSDSP
jgi:hypothetical protein